MNKQIKETKAGHTAEQCDDLIMLRLWLPPSWPAVQCKRNKLCFIPLSITLSSVKYW